MSTSAAWKKGMAAGLTILMLLAPLAAGLAQDADIPRTAGTFDWEKVIDGLMNSRDRVMKETPGACSEYRINGYDHTILHSGEIQEQYAFWDCWYAMILTEECAEKYSANLLQMTANYGVPANVAEGEPRLITADAICRLLNEVTGMGLDAASFTRLTTWKIDDKTVAALYVIGDKCYTGFFNAPLILNGDKEGTDDENDGKGE